MLGIRSLVLICLVWLLRPNVPYRAIVGGAPVAARAFALDDETVMGPHHYSRGYPTENADGSVNAVVEIPCGTVGKFEVDDDDGRLHWEHAREGGLRSVDYLPYLVNYGMIPRTLAADGDALDVIVLGRGIERGHVVRTRIIGVLAMANGDTRDDKLIAVPVEPELENGFSKLRDLPELDERYSAIRDILWLWFANYWGAGATHVIGWGNAAEAAAILEDAKLAFTARTAPRGAAGLRPAASSPFAALARSPARPDRPAARD